MNIRYKLTEQNLTTYNDTKWVLNEWKETSGNGELCNSGWLHCYTSPLLAILLNPIHARITNPKLFKCEIEGKCLTDYGLKEGWTRMRIIEEMEVPQLSNINKIAFGILCALEICKDEKFVKWANSWLENKDRSKESASAVYASYVYASYFSSYDAARYSAAADAARYDAARYSAAADAARYDAARYSAAASSLFSAYAAESTAYGCVNSANIDLIKLAEKAMEIK